MKNHYFIYLYLLLYSLTGPNWALGDPNAGETKSLICSACHNANGISTHPLWPNLAGQHASYLLKQLQQFKQGKTRSAPTMSPIVTTLTTKDMEDLSVFYAKKPLAPPIKTPKPLPRGEQLYRQGDPNQHIPACIACHGPDGRGNEQAGFPIISHQKPDYTTQQLMAFKTGTRSSDQLAIMRTIAVKLSPEDITQLAQYLAGLQ